MCSSSTCSLDVSMAFLFSLFHKICNYAAQAKETLAHICRLTVKPVPHTVIQTEHLSTLLSLSPSTVRHSSHPGYASLFRARCEALWSENSCGCRPRTPSFVSEETVVPQRRILHSHLTGETSRSTGRCYRIATSF